MLRAGLIRQVSSGLYIWLPTGLRVLKKIKDIIRAEMNKIDAIEMSMPIVQPAELWKKSGRWTKYGPELLRFKNRNNQDFILSPTHEEMISELIHKEIISQKKALPLNLYQINTKYRDEARPCFGIIRAREFIMKDGYSFHTNQQSLQNTYNQMYDTYCTIFNKMALNFFVTQANPGKIGGILSHEFQAYSQNRKHNISTSTAIFTKNINKDIHCLKSQNLLINPTITTKSSIVQKNTTQLITISNIHSIAELINKLNLPIKKIVKIIIVHINNNKYDNIYSHNFIGLVIRADHKLSYKKIKMIPQISFPLSFANSKELYNLTGDIQINILGAINITMPLIIDYNVAVMHDFVAGSNIHNKYFLGMNWNQNLPILQIADLHEPKEENNLEINTKKEKLLINKFTEIGHIFQLGQNYSNIIFNHALAYANTHTKKKLLFNMGCYGIGITRIVAVIIEQHHDKNGIIWPDSVAPFKLAIIPINMYHSDNVKNTTEKIYNQLLSSYIGVDVLLYDQPENPGVMFSNIDLIGIPHILIISDRNLKNQEIEYKQRNTGTITKIKINILLPFIIEKLST